MEKAPRTIKELLILLREHIIEEEKENFYGMCNELYYMNYLGSVSDEEFFILEDYLQNNVPFTWYKTFSIFTSAYWWIPGDKTSRIKWLNKKINKL
jgi:hypothetical protein